MEAAGNEPTDAGGIGPSSWRELVAALVALRAEVAAVRCVPVVEVPASPGGAPPDSQPSYGTHGGAAGEGVAEVLRRIDAVSAAAVEATSSSARRSSSAEHPERS
jgi:hypothetical protein